MEKNNAPRAPIRKIALTGPESTGKSTLAQNLATHFSTVWIPEYARTYVENLNRHYTYNDVEHIAYIQYEQLMNCMNLPAIRRFVFFDTDIIITKIWFREVYQKIPPWMESAIAQSGIDLYLLCAPDLAWEPDPVRENGSRREFLFQQYLQEIENYGLNYRIVNGVGERRLAKAIQEVENWAGGQV
jgi:NadR type nicotinamide-nucleotide adenylyltransferase